MRTSQEIAMQRAEGQQQQRKPWTRPKWRRIGTGLAQFSGSAGGDGSGFS
jgi:hypothetical protein